MLYACTLTQMRLDTIMLCYYVIATWLFAVVNVDRTQNVWTQKRWLFFLTYTALSRVYGAPLWMHSHTFGNQWYKTCTILTTVSHVPILKTDVHLYYNYVVHLSSTPTHQLYSCNSIEGASTLNLWHEHSISFMSLILINTFPWVVIIYHNSVSWNFIIKTSHL